MDLRWIAGSLDSDSEALEPVLLWIRSESHRKRSRRRRVCLSWPYIICVLVNDFRSFNDATNQRMTSGQSFSPYVNSFFFTTSCWRTASHSFCDTILECLTSSFFFSTGLFILVVLCLYLFAAPVNLLNTNAATPPPDVAPTVMTVMLAMHAGHTSIFPF